MDRRVRRWVQCGVLAGILVSSVARAGEPVVGVDVGVAAPTSTFRKTADIGGAIAPFVGYQFGEKFALTVLGQPQFVAFPTAVCKNPQSEVTSLFSFTAGPRISLNDEGKEIYLSAQGGIYADLTGPLDNDDAGFNIAAGFNYDFSPGTALGLYIRRDQTGIPAARGSEDDLTFITTGLSFRHRFTAPPPPPPPPAPVVAQAPAPAPPPAIKKKIVLRGVNFDFDKALIRADASPILDEAASTLKEYGSITIAVEGHTDAVGTDLYNQTLSLRRAEAVADYLASHGIKRSRLTTDGFGESRPVATNDTSEGRAQNRRVELRITSE